MHEALHYSTGIKRYVENANGERTRKRERGREREREREREIERERERESEWRAVPPKAPEGTW